MEDTIGALGTPLGESGIGIIRLSGANTEKIIEELFVPHKPENWQRRESHKLYLGHFRQGVGQEQLIDQVLVVIMKGPQSYTGEDMGEIHCHGGFMAVTGVLDAVLAGGARLAQPGEFARRAVLNGKLDLAQAEATIDLIRAKSKSGLSSALANLEGRLSRAIREYRQELLRILAHCEAAIDFPDEEIQVLSPTEIKNIVIDVKNNLKALIASHHQGRIFQEGLKTIILGKPNVGKSSLLNALAGEERAIVTNIPGTTRDLIEEFINLGGIPLQLIDTAGIRPTEDLVEKIGVEKTKAILQDGDLALLVLDAGTGITEQDELIFSLVEKAEIPLLVLLNKIDLADPVLDTQNIRNSFPQVEVLGISALTGYGIPGLTEKITKMMELGAVTADPSALLTRRRHVESLTIGVQHLREVINGLELGLPEDFLTIDLKGAWEALGEITGETIGEDVLDKIFAEFCIGK